jgi:molecular chaperone DnaK
MAKDAESHSADDRKLKDTIEARNRADAMVYNVEKTLKEHRTKVSDAEAKEIEESLEATRKAMAENDPAAINSAVDRLTTASHKLAEAMYKASSQPGGATPPPSGDGGPGGAQGGAGGTGKSDKDNVVDAEFVDVDDKK